MNRETIRDWIRGLERAEHDEQWMLLCFLAGRGVGLDADEVNAALRRAELLLVAGGDPHRRLELFGRAVTAVARDLDDPCLRHRLDLGLAGLEPEVADLRGAAEALRVLRSDPDLAWQCFAASLLADDLGSEDDAPGR